MAAATEVFNIPELLELILLSLPWHGTHQEISSSRTIQLGQGTCRAWRALVQQSTPIRQKLYRATPADRRDMKAWSLALVEPPARPNPWIPNLLLHQRSWGQADPFDQADDVYRVRDDAPRLWAFALEISQAQFLRVPEAGPWREMLATSPPFTDFWYTRCFYELGSGMRLVRIDLGGDVAFLTFSACRKSTVCDACRLQCHPPEMPAKVSRTLQVRYYSGHDRGCYE